MCRFRARRETHRNTAKKRKERKNKLCFPRPFFLKERQKQRERGREREKETARFAIMVKKQILLPLFAIGFKSLTQRWGDRDSEG